MIEDPIVEEVRRTREAHAAMFNYDLERIIEDLRRSANENRQRTVSFPPRPAEPPRRRQSA